MIVGMTITDSINKSVSINTISFDIQPYQPHINKSIF
jgi:hypothetical protein